MKQVLVIDDEAYVREALQRVLEGPDTTVVCAATALQGLERLRDVAIDVLIMDLVLPGEDSIDAIATVRRNWPATRVLAISGGGMQGVDDYQPEAIATQAYMAAARKAGADAVLAKPFATAQLREQLGQLLAPRDAVPA